MSFIQDHLEGIVVLALAGVAGWQQYRAVKISERTAVDIAKRADHAAVDAAKDEQIALLKEDREIYRTRYQREHDEYKEYREKTHDIANDINAKMIRISSENAELKVKTDITPLMVYTKEQSEINNRIIKSLDRILERLPETIK